MTEMIDPIEGTPLIAPSDTAIHSTKISLRLAVRSMTLKFQLISMILA